MKVDAWTISKGLPRCCMCRVTTVQSHHCAESPLCNTNLVIAWSLHGIRNQANLVNTKLHNLYSCDWEIETNATHLTEIINNYRTTFIDLQAEFMPRKTYTIVLWKSTHGTQHSELHHVTVSMHGVYSSCFALHYLHPPLQRYLWYSITQSSYLRYA